MVRIRIGDNDAEKVGRMVDWWKRELPRFIDGYSIHHMEGVWKGEHENAVEFSFALTSDVMGYHYATLADLATVCGKFCMVFSQECVFVEVDGRSWFVGK
jgi:hypothetical protein